jgi:hypothetical protein
MASHPRPALIFTAVNTSNLILNIFASFQAAVPKLLQSNQLEFKKMLQRVHQKKKVCNGKYLYGNIILSQIHITYDKDAAALFFIKSNFLQSVAVAYFLSLSKGNDL